MKLLNKIKDVAEDILFVEVVEEKSMEQVDSLVLSKIVDKADKSISISADTEEDFYKQLEEAVKLRKAYNNYNDVIVKEVKEKKQISDGAWKFWATVVSGISTGAIVIYSTLYSDEGNFVNDFTRKVINKKIDGDKF
jgi:hypothetical protein